MPLGATAMRDWVAQKFEDSAYLHGYTYSGHPVAMAAGVATLKIYNSDNLIERSAKMGDYLFKKKGYHIMTINGYMGQMLSIDLASAQVERELLNLEWAEKYIGGSGLAARYLYRSIDSSTRPKDPENPILFMTGPLCGTRSITSGRHQVVSLSPLTGIFGEADTGGTWGKTLKMAGFDGVIVTGKSLSPVYLWINNGRAEIRPAEHLWGMDTFEVESRLREETNPKADIACIGPAAEKGARIAAIMHHGPHARAAGRCGLGAVMADKKIKALVVHGTNRISVADPDGLKQLVRAHVRQVVDQLGHMRQYGTPSIVQGTEQLGSLPVQNFKYPVRWEQGARALSGTAMTEKSLIKKKYFCDACVIGCGNTVSVKEGRHKTSTAAGPEYETLAFLGASCLVDNLEAVCLANELCNRYGVDTMETGHMVAFAMECYENGLITASECGGVALGWGDADAMLEAVRMIGEGRHIGGILNQGLLRAVEHIGGKAGEFAMHVKGLGLPGHDPRVFNGMACNYATANRGAHHMEGQTHLYESKLALPELGHKPPGSLKVEGKGKLTALSQNIMNVLDSLKSCKFAQNGGWTIGPLTEAYKYVTGRRDTLKDLLLHGERSFNLKRLINIDRGISRKDDTLPKRILSTAKTGEGHPSNLPPLETMLDEYYEARGWSPQGIPSQATKDRLELP
ncbi:MAG: aminotransferase class III-fold pyridoxal phosphate-dependent enzyme [Thermodesulfobacteriota bacterium]